jgi:hypothetical protein
MPSPEVADFLIELYFTNIRFSTLLFHKKTFLRDFAEKRIADFVSLGIFALATVYFLTLRGMRVQTNSAADICEKPASMRMRLT